MAIKSGQAIDRTEMTLSTDYTVVNSSSVETREVYSLIFHDHGSEGGVVELFISDDAVSAAAERIDRIVVDPSSTSISNSIVVGASKYLVAKSDSSNINYHGAFILRNGADI